MDPMKLLNFSLDDISKAEKRPNGSRRRALRRKKPTKPVARDASPGAKAATLLNFSLDDIAKADKGGRRPRGRRNLRQRDLSPGAPNARRRRQRRERDRFSEDEDVDRSCRIFVGNLSWETSWQDLKDLFNKVGNVVRADVMEDRRGRSKGCGIVEFETQRGARRAIKKVDGYEFDGRELFIQQDLSIEEREEFEEPASKRKSAARRRTQDDARNVFVGNVSFDTTWQFLKDHMRQAGDVEHVEIFERRDGRSKGSALVTYTSKKGARSAMKLLDGTELDGREIFVREDRGEIIQDEDETPSRSTRRRRKVPVADSDEESDADYEEDEPEERWYSLYVGNLAYETSWQDLKDLFSECGDSIRRTDVPRSPDGRSKGFGIVKFASKKDAKRAIVELNETEFQGRTIFVRPDQGRQ